jgi:hypothetical protein
MDLGFAGMILSVTGGVLVGSGRPLGVAGNELRFARTMLGVAGRLLGVAGTVLGVEENASRFSRDRALLRRDDDKRRAVNPWPRGEGARCVRSFRKKSRETAKVARTLLLFGHHESGSG